MEKPKTISLMLANSGGADFGDFLRLAQAYPDVALASICTSPDQLERFLREAKPEACILDGNMVDNRDRPGMAVRGVGFEKFEAIRQVSLDTVFVVVLDPDQAELRPRFAALPGVREVLVRPVNAQAVVARTAELGFERRRQVVEMAPMMAAQPGPRTTAAPVAMPHQKVIAIMSWSGGVGKSTLAVALWQVINTMGVPCLLMGFCRQDALRFYLGLGEPADMLQYLRRPNLEGFLSSIQNFGDWPVMLAPRNEIEAMNAMAESKLLLRDLVYQARERFPCIVMDLPHTKEPWSIDPLRRANVVLTVLCPTRIHVDQLVFGTHALLTLNDGGKELVPRESIFTILNMAHEGDIVNPTYLAQAFASGIFPETFASWCPPNLAVVRFDPSLRELQDYFDPSKTTPVRLLEPGNPARGGVFMEGVQAVVASIFAGTALPALAPQQKKQGLLTRLLG
jgi:hypothetical protein